MGSFLVYATIIVGAILVFVGFVNSNPLQSMLAYRWIGLQCIALFVYVVASLTNDSLDQDAQQTAIGSAVAELDSGYAYAAEQAGAFAETLVAAQEDMWAEYTPDPWLPQEPFLPS